MTLAELDAWFRSFLAIDELAPVDSSANGIQIACSDKPVRRAAFAVDTSLECIRRAAEWGADLLVVHHGLLWGALQPVTGVLYARVSELIRRDMALYAIHLPLDQHESVGNNAVMADALGLVDRKPFGLYKGRAIGWRGRLPEKSTLAKISSLLLGGSEALAVLPFGPEQIETVGIVSGGGTREVLQAIDIDLDLYITGDAAHIVYHDCLEAGINVMFGGHYRTETWGVEALARRTAADCGLETRFFDIPTGL